MVSPPETIHVLHVDDEPEYPSMIGEFLEIEDDRIVVETALDAKEGLERLASGGIDCVVSDYAMPGMDGLEFLEQVREEYGDLPFIMVTGKGSEEIASEAITAGVNEYFKKAVGTDQYELLARAIVDATEGAE